MKTNNPPLPSEDDSLWKIVLQRLWSPRTWIYPIIVLLFAFFVLPRLSQQGTPPVNKTDSGTTMFGNSGTQQETVDAEGNIHRFVTPSPVISPVSAPSPEKE